MAALGSGLWVPGEQQPAAQSRQCRTPAGGIVSP